MTNQHFPLVQCKLSLSIGTYYIIESTFSNTLPAQSLSQQLYTPSINQSRTPQMNEQTQTATRRVSISRTMTQTGDDHWFLLAWTAAAPLEYPRSPFFKPMCARWSRSSSNDSRIPKDEQTQDSRLISWKSIKVLVSCPSTLLSLSISVFM